MGTTLDALNVVEVAELNPNLEKWDSSEVAALAGLGYTAALLAEQASTGTGSLIIIAPGGLSGAGGSDSPSGLGSGAVSGEAPCAGGSGGASGAGGSFGFGGVYFRLALFFVFLFRSVSALSLLFKLVSGFLTVDHVYAVENNLVILVAVPMLLVIVGTQFCFLGSASALPVGGGRSRSRGVF